MELRHLTAKELQFMAIALAQQEGWNPGFYDAKAFYAADPEGFIGGFIDGEPIACISAVRYPDQFAFLGFYIVRPEFRGLGYGMQVWSAAMEQMKNYNIGLDGVPDQQANYLKSGFKLAYRNIRYTGKKSMDLSDEKCMQFNADMMSDITAFDHQCFPSKREAFLSAWLHMPGNNVKAFYESGKLKGYGVIRPCYAGYKIGPLFADSVETAMALLNNLIGGIPINAAYFIDIPEVNQAAAQMIEWYNLNPVFETARMYTGEAPEINLDYIFGVTSFELG
jgi:GNAT superfamily N-acetyltransferase